VYLQFFYSSLNLAFMDLLRILRHLGLKTTLDKYEVPREDLPTIAERALGRRSGVHGDVVAFLEGCTPRHEVTSRKFGNL
jgi:hypothetical protein